MNVATLVKRLGIKEEKVSEKATELLRRADTKGSLRGQVRQPRATSQQCTNAPFAVGRRKACLPE
eukprot:8698367-Pyramimonas_sp.AAC.1